MNEKTLPELKAIVELNKDEGIHCPCCSLFVKRYKRKLTSSTAFGLILINRETKANEWVHLSSFFTQRKILYNGEQTRGCVWGLLEANEEKAADGNSGGFFRITQKGRDFVQGRIQVPRYCWIFNNQTERFSEELTDVRAALTDKFDYRELMGKSLETYDISQTDFFN